MLNFSASQQTIIYVTYSGLENEKVRMERMNVQWDKGNSLSTRPTGPERNQTAIKTTARHKDQSSYITFKEGICKMNRVRLLSRSPSPCEWEWFRLPVHLCEYTNIICLRCPRSPRCQCAHKHAHALQWFFLAQRQHKAAFYLLCASHWLIVLFGLIGAWPM